MQPDLLAATAVAHDGALETAVREAVLGALGAPDLVQLDALRPDERAQLITHLRELHALLSRVLAAVPVV